MRKPVKKPAVKKSAATKAKSVAAKTKPAAAAKINPALFDRADGKRIVLHLGAGAKGGGDKLHPLFSGADWRAVRADTNAALAPDLVIAPPQFTGVPDNSCDAVWSSHGFQRLDTFAVPAAFSEAFRVLREGGSLLITVPDLQAIARHVADGKMEEPLYTTAAGPIKVLDILFGVEREMRAGLEQFRHKTAYTAQGLGQHFKTAGFYNIEIKREGFNLWGLAHRLPETAKNRSDKIVIVDKGAPLYARNNYNALSDELDTPPQIWKEVKLK